jgi:hypothetical protein
VPYKFDWNDKETGILEVKVDHLSSWDEYHQIIDRMIQEIETTPLNRIDIIVSSIGRMMDGDPIPHMQRTYRDLVGREKLGLLLLVSRNYSGAERQLLQLVGRIVLKTAGVAMAQMRMIVNSHEEALQLIMEDRANINNAIWAPLRKR